MGKLRVKPTVINIDPNKVAIYVRWSTDEQGEGTTLQIQLERCKQYILSQGWVVNENLIYIDDGYSGGTLNRPAITKLRKDVEDGLVECVVVFKLDRLSRSIVDTVNLVLDEWDEVCYIKSVTEPFDTTTQLGKQILTILAGFAEWERYNIKLRTFEGKIETVEKGRSPGITCPYGYTVGDKKGTFKIVPHEAEIVRRIFREYRNGKGVRAICTELNKEGIPFRNGKKWSTNTIAYMLSNKLYTGVLVYGKTQTNTKRLKKSGEPWRLKRDKDEIMVKKLPEDVITPIIDVNLFEAVQKIKKSRNVFINHETSGRRFTSPYLLSGLLRCKECGFGLSARGKQKKDNFSYYYCRGDKQKGTGHCSSGAIRQELLNEYVINKFKEKFSSNDNIIDYLIKQSNQRLTELNTILQGIDESLNKLDKEFETIKRKLRNDNLDVSTFNMLRNDIENEALELKTKREKILQEIREIEDSKIDEEEVKELNKALNKWESLDIQTQKLILSKWIDYIEVYKPKGIMGKDDKIDIHIQWKTDNIELIKEKPQD